MNYLQNSCYARDASFITSFTKKFVNNKKKRPILSVFFVINSQFLLNNKHYFTICRRACIPASALIFLADAIAIFRRFLAPLNINSTLSLIFCDGDMIFFSINKFSINF